MPEVAANGDTRMETASKARRFTLNKLGIASLLLLVGTISSGGTAFTWKISGIRCFLESQVLSNVSLRSWQLLFVGSLR